MPKLNSNWDINYAKTEETEDYEEYYDKEPVYVSQNSRLCSYSIKKKEARQKQSESQKEHILRSNPKISKN
ncbi:8753_t:CDS:2 [Scutellospora calospora]|uniref:8753_t:CDS:1 n=1 Tax=Scutellospora calospora TaxID=85575 RepID=A0ACA9KB39_9GLOM|nr:8753_t:CDS:2 [Scutellospora calospora]